MFQEENLTSPDSFNCAGRTGRLSINIDPLEGPSWLHSPNNKTESGVSSSRRMYERKELLQTIRDKKDTRVSSTNSLNHSYDSDDDINSSEEYTAVELPIDDCHGKQLPTSPTSLQPRQSITSNINISEIQESTDSSHHISKQPITFKSCKIRKMSSGLKADKQNSSDVCAKSRRSRLSVSASPKTKPVGLPTSPKSPATIDDSICNLTSLNLMERSIPFTPKIMLKRFEELEKRDSRRHKSKSKSRKFSNPIVAEGGEIPANQTNSAELTFTSVVDQLRRSTQESEPSMCNLNEVPNDTSMTSFSQALRQMSGTCLEQQTMDLTNLDSTYSHNLADKNLPISNPVVKLEIMSSKNIQNCTSKEQKKKNTSRKINNFTNNSKLNSKENESDDLYSLTLMDETIKVSDSCKSYKLLKENRPPESATHADSERPVTIVSPPGKDVRKKSPSTRAKINTRYKAVRRPPMESSKGKRNKTKAERDITSHKRASLDTSRINENKKRSVSAPRKRRREAKNSNSSPTNERKFSKGQSFKVRPKVSSTFVVPKTSDENGSLENSFHSTQSTTIASEAEDNGALSDDANDTDIVASEAEDNVALSNDSNNTDIAIVSDVDVVSLDSESEQVARYTVITEDCSTSAVNEEQPTQTSQLRKFRMTPNKNTTNEDNIEFIDIDDVLEDKVVMLDDGLEVLPASSSTTSIHAKKKNISDSKTKASTSNNERRTLTSVSDRSSCSSENGEVMRESSSEDTTILHTIIAKDMELDFSEESLKQLVLEENASRNDEVVYVDDCLISIVQNEHEKTSNCFGHGDSNRKGEKNSEGNAHLLDEASHPKRRATSKTTSYREPSLHR